MERVHREGCGGVEKTPWGRLPGHQGKGKIIGQGKANAGQGKAKAKARTRIRISNIFENKLA